MKFPDKIIDAHHHLWNPVSGTPDIGYVWLKKIGAPKPFGDPTPIQRDYLIDEFLSETKIPIVGSVHVQADGAIPDPIAETAFIQSMGHENSFPISVVGFVDLTKADAEAVILAHKAYSSITGIRQILSRLDDHAELCFAPEHFLRENIWRENFSLLKEHNLSFDLQLYPEQMPDAADFLAMHPDIPVIIDHAGSPYNNSKKGYHQWLKGMKQLSLLENVSVKLSGLGMFGLHRSGKRDAKPYIENILEIFGMKRVLFGSNFPVDKLMSTYDDCIENITDCLPKGSENKAWLGAIFHDNAKKLYRL